MLFYFSFGSNNLLNYDKQHNNNMPHGKKSILKTYMFTHTLLSISLNKNHYSTPLIIIIFLLNKI